MKYYRIKLKKFELENIFSNAEYESEDEEGNFLLFSEMQLESLEKNYLSIECPIEVATQKFISIKHTEDGHYSGILYIHYPSKYFSFNGNSESWSRRKSSDDFDWEFTSYWFSMKNILNSDIIEDSYAIKIEINGSQPKYIKKIPTKKDAEEKLKKLNSILNSKEYSDKNNNVKISIVLLRETRKLTISEIDEPGILF